MIFTIRNILEKLPNLPTTQTTSAGKMATILLRRFDFMDEDVYDMGYDRLEETREGEGPNDIQHAQVN